MKALDGFSEAALGKRQANEAVVSSGVLSPTSKCTRNFLFQSFFDDAQLQTALLLQPPGDMIVSPQEEQIKGYAIGLHPSSQTPVAIQFKGHGNSAPLILKPGQVERPFGEPRGTSHGQFDGFRWGLPFGWLGGGMATLHVFTTPDADVAWNGDSEVIFHRQRMQICTQAALPANAPLNWPMRFPWPNARFGGVVTPTPQGAQSTISISRPTRVFMRLRLGTIAAPGATMRILFQNTNDFDLDNTGAVVANRVSFIDFTWPSVASLGLAGNLNPAGVGQFPLAEIETGFLVRSQAENGGVQLMAIDAALNNIYVDVVRYGFI